MPELKSTAVVTCVLYCMDIPQSSSYRTLLGYDLRAARVFQVAHHATSTVATTMGAVVHAAVIWLGSNSGADSQKRRRSYTHLVNLNL